MTNPLQKYLTKQPYVPVPLTPRVAQYLLKALDYLHIYSVKHNEPALVEQPLHGEVEEMVVDVIASAPEEDDDGKTTQ